VGEPVVLDLAKCGRELSLIRRAEHAFEGRMEWAQTVIVAIKLPRMDAPAGARHSANLMATMTVAPTPFSPRMMLGSHGSVTAPAAALRQIENYRFATKIFVSERSARSRH